VPFWPLSKMFLNGPFFAGQVKYLRSTGRDVTDTARTTTSGEHTERGYLVRYDAIEQVRTSSRRNWIDVFHHVHTGTPDRRAKWRTVTDSVEVWVPASEIHHVGELTDLRHLDPDDVTHYHAGRAADAERDTPGATRPADNGPAGKGKAVDSEPEPVRAPATVGKGHGRVELYRPQHQAELVRRIQVALDEHSPQPDRTATSRARRLVEIAYQALLRPTLDRPESEPLPTAQDATGLDALNQRLVDDVLAPTANSGGFAGALGEMLVGRRPMILSGDSAYGHLEQLVLLHAELGEGQYQRTVPGRTTTTDTDTAVEQNDTSSSGWSGLVAAGYAGYASGHRDPASLMTTGPALVFDRTTGSADPRSSATTTTSRTTGDQVRFVHDLTVHLEVFPHAKPGFYRRQLAKLAFWRTPRQFGEPWRTSFTLRGAARSTVAREETIPLAGLAPRPIERVTGRLSGGFSPEAKAHVRPFAAPKLNATIEDLIKGDASGTHPRPELRQRTAHQLWAAVTGTEWQSHLTDAMSSAEHEIPVVGDRLNKLTIGVDLVRRELLGVLPDGSLDRTGKDRHTPKVTSETSATLLVNNYLDLRGTAIDNASYRPGALITDYAMQAKAWKSATEHGASTEQAHEATADDTRGDDTRGDDTGTDHEPTYLVRVTPRWRVRPDYHGAKIPDAWQQVIHVGRDEPILLEVNRAGLADLGLHVPDRKGKGRAAPDPDFAQPGPGNQPGPSNRPEPGNRPGPAKPDAAGSPAQQKSTVDEPVADRETGPAEQEGPALSLTAFLSGPSTSAARPTDPSRPAGTDRDAAPGPADDTAQDETEQEPPPRAADEVRADVAAHAAGVPAHPITRDGRTVLFEAKRFRYYGDDVALATLRVRFTPEPGVDPENVSEAHQWMTYLADSVVHQQVPRIPIGPRYQPNFRMAIEPPADDEEPHLDITLTHDPAATLSPTVWPLHESPEEFFGQLLRHLGALEPEPGKDIVADFGPEQLTGIGDTIQGSWPPHDNPELLLEENPAIPAGYDVDEYDAARNAATVLFIDQPLTHPFFAEVPHARFEMRRFTVGGDNVVEATVRLGFRLDKSEAGVQRDVALELADDTWSSLLYAVNMGVNEPRLIFPENLPFTGDRFLLRVRWENDSRRQFYLVSLVGDRAHVSRSVQWLIGEDPAVYLHEVLHMLGFFENYKGKGAALPGDVVADVDAGRTPGLMRRWNGRIDRLDAGNENTLGHAGQHDFQLPVKIRSTQLAWLAGLIDSQVRSQIGAATWQENQAGQATLGAHVTSPGIATESTN